MINFEKHKKGISEMLEKYSDWADFNDINEDAEDIANTIMYTWSDFFNWGMSEWVPQLTDIDKFILTHLKPEYKWIARDENNSIYLYNTLPYKEDRQWNTHEKFCHYCLNDLATKIFGLYPLDLFSFISWNDDNPWSIDELKKLVKEDDTDGKE